MPPAPITGNLDPVQHLVEQHEEGKLASHVATGFSSLGDDEIAAGIRGRASLVGGADLPRCKRPTFMDMGRHEFGVRCAVEELDHPRSCCCGLHRCQVEEGDEEIDPECTRRLRRDLIEHGCRVVAWHDHPERSGVRDRDCQIWRGYLWHAGLLERDSASEQLGERRFHSSTPLRRHQRANISRPPRPARYRRMQLRFASPTSLALAHELGVTTKSPSGGRSRARQSGTAAIS